MDRKCLLCNVDISHRSVQAKYCSTQCLQKYIRINNPKRYKSYAKKHYDNNTEKRIKTVIDWVSKNMDRHLSNQTAWRKSNPNKVKAIRKRCSDKPEQKEKQHIRHKQWASDNRNRVRQHSISSEGKRRAIKANCKSDVLDINDVLIRDIFTCQCCGRMDVELHIDHIIPLSKGGAHKMNNLQTLCHSCNLSFGGKIKTKELISTIKNKILQLNNKNYGE